LAFQSFVFQRMLDEGYSKKRIVCPKLDIYIRYGNNQNIGKPNNLSIWEQINQWT